MVAESVNGQQAGEGSGIAKRVVIQTAAEDLCPEDEGEQAENP